MEEICPVANTERLLLATDGSKFSEGAVREAVRLAKQCSSTLAAITVIETNPEYETIAPQLLERAEKEARGHLDSVKAEARKAGIDCAASILEGEDSYHYISEEAAKTKSSMIVMGRRGRTGLKRLAMGSTTARVIGHAPCNIMVVPHTAQVEFKNILVATDGSRHSLAAAAEAIGIAKRNKSRLTVVSVVPAEIATPADVEFAMPQRELIAEKEVRDAEKCAKAVKDAAQKEGVEARAFVMSGRPADAIVETAKDKGADLIVMGSHGRTGLERLLMGSVTERVIVLSGAAVLVVKGK